MLVRRSLLRLFAAALLAAAWPLAASASDTKHAEDFVASLADQAVQSLTIPDISRQERVTRFRKMFNEHFAVKSIGRWVLGKHWGQTTDAEKDEYQKLFEDLMIATYVDRFANYSGETLKIQKSTPGEEGAVTVFSHIMRKNPGDPINVAWRIASKDNVTKVMDVLVEGTSMSATLRSEFASIVSQKGGKISGLLEVLRDKTAALRDAK
ncbi:MAG: ABC transporter substrate-binding protein [Magnetospirillum sp. WYHS-4]